MVGWCNEIIWHELKTYLTHSFNVSFFLARIKKTQLDQPVPNQMLKNLLQFSFTSTCSVQLLSILWLHHSNAHIFSQIPPTDGCVLHTEIRSLCTFFFLPESAAFASNFYYNKSSLFQSASTFLAFFFCIFHIRFDWRNLVIFFLLCARNRALLLHVKGDSFWRISRDYVPSSSFRPCILHESGVAAFLGLNALENKFLYAIFWCIRSIRDAPGDDCSQSDWGCPIT